MEKRRQPKQNRGFTMIEVLVALLILSVGLLGLAALQTSGVKFNQDAYIRSQATNIAYDAIERMRINRAVAIANSYGGTHTTASSSDSCNFTGTTAANEILCWRVAIRDNLPNGSVVISAPGGTNSNEFTLTVSWSDRSRQRDATTASTSSQSWIFEL